MGINKMNLFGMVVAGVMLAQVISTQPTMAATTGYREQIKHIAGTDKHLEIETMSMTTARNGWAMGHLSASAGYENMVFSTADGGLIWQNATPRHMVNGQRALSAGFAGTQSAVIAVNGSSGIVVYVTTDGGRKWVVSKPLATAYPNGNLYVQFVNRQCGFIEVSTGGNGTLYGSLLTTANGGQTWRQVSNSSIVPGRSGWLPFAEGFSFENAKDGWMGGAQRAFSGGNFGGSGFLWMYRTIDGGKNWIHVILPFPDGFAAASTDVSQPQWFGRTGYIVIRYTTTNKQNRTGMFLYETRDGGQKWVPVRTSPPGSVDFVNTRVGYALSSGRLFRTGDGGVTWEQVAAHAAWREYTSLQFVTSSDGWIEWVDQYGSHWERTTDGGRMWTAYTPVTGKLLTSRVVSKRHIFIWMARSFPIHIMLDGQDGNHVFVLFSDITPDPVRFPDGFRFLKEGQRVSFDLIEKPGITDSQKRTAINVEILAD